MKPLIQILALLVFAAACDDRTDVLTPDEPQLVTGEWEGSIALGRIEMVLAQDEGGRITGSGFIRRFGLVTNPPFDVSGANAFPNVSLSFTFGLTGLEDPRIGSQLVNYHAEFDASRNTLSLVGRLNGGVLQEVFLRLSRTE